jgi:hypothetical protein
MAQKKITELPYANSIDNDDVFPIVQDGVTKQIEFTNLKDPLVKEVQSDLNFLQSGKECIVGKWIDGRYIYRRIVSVTDVTLSTSTGRNDVKIADLTFKCSVGGTISGFGWQFLLNANLVYQVLDGNSQTVSCDLFPILKYTISTSTIEFTSRIFNLFPQIFTENDLNDYVPINSVLTYLFLNMSSGNLIKRTDRATPKYIIIDYVKAV